MVALNGAPNQSAWETPHRTGLQKHVSDRSPNPQGTKPIGTKQRPEGRRPRTDRPQPYGHPVTPWSLQCHHPGPEVADVEAAWGPIAPDFTYSATALTQALDPQCQAKAQRDHVAEEWRSAAEGKPQAVPDTPGEYVLPGSSKPAEAKPQQNPKKQTLTHKTQGQPQVKGHQKHQHFTAAQNLTRHGQHHGTGKTESRKGKGVSHFRYNCKRDIKEDSLW